MTAYIDPPHIGELVVTPLGKLARVMGYDGDGRCELRYQAASTEDGNGERVMVWPKLLHKPRDW